MLAIYGRAAAKRNIHVSYCKKIISEISDF